VQLGVSDETIYNWRNQDRIDRGLRAGVSTVESAELAAARKRIRGLETELAVTKRANELSKAQSDPKRWEVRRASRERGPPNRGDVPNRRCFGVRVYMWRKRKPSARAVRHAMVAEVIRQVHAESRQTYGARPVHAEFVRGREMTVARCTVAHGTQYTSWAFTRRALDSGWCHRWARSATATTMVRWSRSGRQCRSSCSPQVVEHAPQVGQCDLRVP
jgi:transposase-like protein